MATLARAAAAGALLVLAACSDQPAQPAPAPVAAAPASVEPAVPDDQVDPSASGQVGEDAGPRKLGARVISSDGAFNTAALAYRQPVARTAPRPDEQPGYEWAAADVRVCSAKDARAAAVSRAPWALVYADGTRAEPSSTTYQQFPLPEYPVAEKVLRAGRCIRGWITFPVPKGERPATVEYATEDGMEFAEWALPQG